MLNGTVTDSVLLTAFLFYFLSADDYKWRPPLTNDDR